jgi:hypothetical protein
MSNVKVLIFALSLLAGGILLMCLPLLLGDFAWNKYFVTFGLVAAMLGLSVSFNALCDRFRKRS